MATQTFMPPMMPAVARILSGYDRAKVEAFVEVAIGLFDMLDGDSEAEEDDPSGQCDEDGVNTGSGAYMPQGTSYAGPGCPISDDDCSYY